MKEVIFNWISRGFIFARDRNLIQNRVLDHLLIRLFSVMTPANLVDPAFPTTFIQLSWAWQLRRPPTSGFSRSWSSTHSNTGLVNNNLSCTVSINKASFSILKCWLSMCSRKFFMREREPTVLISFSEFLVPKSDNLQRGAVTSMKFSTLA